MKKRVFKILLVEDNFADARLFQEILSEGDLHSYTIDHADRISSARTKLDEKNCDVVILDLSLPDSSGIDSVKSMCESNPEIPIIVLTGLSDNEAALEALQNGAQDYIIKGEVNYHLLEKSIYYAMERKNISNELQASEKRFRKIIDFNADGIMVIDHERKVRLVNSKTQKFFGKDEVSFINSAFEFDLSPGETKEYAIQKPEEDDIHVEMRGAEIEWDKKPGLLVSIRDITERKKLEEKLREMATYDYLTGLPNRALFEERLKDAIKRTNRKNYQTSSQWKLAVIFLDFDKFKAINDLFGHDQGDFVLKTIAARLKSIVRKVDTVARLGGDEFVMLFENIGKVNDIEIIKTKINSVFEYPVQIEGFDVKISASLGYSFYPTNGENITDLIKIADKMMYKEKAKLQ